MVDNGAYKYVLHDIDEFGTICAICCGVAGTGAVAGPAALAGSSSTQLNQVSGVALAGVVDWFGPIHNGMGVSPFAFTTKMTGLVSIAALPSVPPLSGWYGASTTLRALVGVPA